jgi:hypothetical protein
MLYYEHTMSKQILMKAFELAKKKALKSPIHNRFCAVLIYKNTIKSYGYNTFKGPIHTNTQHSILCA